MIMRKPIKIRKPVQLEYCSCFGQNTVSVDGEPQGIYVNGFKEAIAVLKNYTETVTLYIKEELSSEEINAILEYKVPINLLVSSVEYLYDVVPLLTKVPYCGITLVVNRNMHFDRLRELLHVAKSTKIHIITLVQFNPTTTSKLDLFDMVEQIKNYTHHMLLDMRNVIGHESVCASDTKRLSKYYFEGSDGWVLDIDAVTALMSTIQKHFKLRKISVERIEFSPSNGRIRHSMGESNLLFGIRPFFYVKEESGKTFTRTDSLLGTSCKNCGKAIFD